MSKAGDLRRLKLQDDPVGNLEPGEAIVQVRAVGLNFADVFAIKGLYSATPKGPFIPGLEFAGEVLEVSDGVTHIGPGDRVMGVTRFGGYVDHIRINAGYLTHLPADWSFEEGAAFPVQALTAYYGLVFLAHLQEGETVLVHSAAGGVGIWANRIAKKYKAFTIGVVGSAAKLPVLEKEGYDLGMVRGDFDLEEVQNELGDRLPDVVMECIGGPVFKTSYRLMRPQGRLVSYGAAHFGDTGSKPRMLRTIVKYLRRPRIDPLTMMRYNKSIMAFNLIWLYDKVDLMNKLLGELNALQLEKPMIGETFDFSEMHTALRKFQSGETVGKVVVRSG